VGSSRAAIALTLAFGAGAAADDARVREWARQLATSAPELRGQVAEQLVIYSSHALIGHTPDTGRAREALSVVKQHLHTLPNSDRRHTLDLLHDVYHDTAIEILSGSLADSSQDVRYTAAESLLHQANHFATFPEMPSAFHSESVFRAARGADTQLARPATCVLWLVQSSLEGGAPRLPTGSKLWQRIGRELPPRNLNRCE
jgi:hypothetical protein